MLFGITNNGDTHARLDLVRSTEMFGRLANPNSANNALSQVLYGLALRYVTSVYPKVMIRDSTWVPSNPLIY